MNFGRERSLVWCYFLKSCYQRTGGVRSLQHWPCGGDCNFLNSDWLTLHTLWEAAFLEDLSTPFKEAGGEPPQRDEFEVQRRTHPDVTPQPVVFFKPSSRALIHPSLTCGVVTQSDGECTVPA